MEKEWKKKTGRQRSIIVDSRAFRVECFINGLDKTVKEKVLCAYSNETCSWATYTHITVGKEALPLGGR